MDSYGLQLVATTGNEPLTLEQAKLHLREDDEAQDNEIKLLIAGVRKYFEKQTGQVFRAQTWLLTLDHFPIYFGNYLPDYGETWNNELWDITGIRLPKSPVIPAGQLAISSIQYIDTTGALQTVDPATYKVDLTTLPVRITPAWGKVWPVARYETGSVRVQYTVTPAVDEDVLAGMLLLLGHWYEHREAVLAGGYSEVPLGVSAILAMNWDGGYSGKAN